MGDHIRGSIMQYFVQKMREKDKDEVDSLIRDHGINYVSVDDNFFTAAALSPSVSDTMLSWFVHNHTGVKAGFSTSGKANCLHRIILHPFKKFSKMKARIRLFLELGISPHQVTTAALKVNPVSQMLGYFVTSVVNNNPRTWPFNDNETAELVYLFGFYASSLSGVGMKFLIGSYMNRDYRKKVTKMFGTEGYNPFSLWSIARTLNAIKKYCHPPTASADKNGRLIKEFVRDWWYEWEKSQGDKVDHDAVSFLLKYFQDDSLATTGKSVWECIDRGIPGKPALKDLAKDHVNDRNAAGQTPFEYAMAQPYGTFDFEIPLLFLRHMNPNARTPDGDTLYMKYLQRLIDPNRIWTYSISIADPGPFSVAKPDLTARGRGGLTPLHFLAFLFDDQLSWKAIIRWLNLTPADFIPDNKGRTPVDYALEIGKETEGTQYLQDWGVESANEEVDYYIDYGR